MRFLRGVTFTIAMIVALVILVEFVVLTEWKSYFLICLVIYTWLFAVGGRIRDVAILLQLRISLPVLVMVLVLIINAIFFYVLQTEFLHWNWIDADTDLPSYQHGWFFASELLMAVVLAPFVEEVFFRRWLFNQIAKKANQAVSAVVVAIAFCLLHVDVFGAFIFSIVMSYLYRQSGSLALPITIHALYNGFLVVVYWFVDANLLADPEPVLNEFFTDHPAVLMANLTLSLLVLVLLLRRHPKKLLSEPNTKDASGNTTLVQPG